MTARKIIYKLFISTSNVYSNNNNITATYTGGSKNDKQVFFIDIFLANTT